jgi:hypothetical protein
VAAKRRKYDGYLLKLLQPRCVVLALAAALLDDAVGIGLGLDAAILGRRRRHPIVAIYIG